MSKLIPLTSNEMTAYKGYNYGFIIDAIAGDLTVSATNTEQQFVAFNTQDQDQMRNVGMVLSESFQNTADAAYNTTTIRVGDQDDDDVFITATQINKNGTVVTEAYNTGDGVPATYTGKKAIWVTIGTQAAKALTSLNKGRVIILFDLFRPDQALKQRPTGD